MILRLAVFSSLLFLTTAWTPNFHLGRRKGGMRVVPERTEPAKPASSGSGFTAWEGWIQQKLDHFSNDNRTWSQRYFGNLQFSQARGATVAFLNLGGEGPESITWVEREDLPWLQWAQEYKAAVFSLEHRFYGQSRPFQNQSVEHLQYLSSRQALADAAEFISQISAKYSLQNARWIVFGGSYSGALALWMRQLYPNVVQGAVGSSAPVQATFDFYEYLKVVEDSLGNEDVGGSAACVTRVREAFAQMIQMMNTVDGRKNLTQEFDLQPAFDSDNIGYNDIQNYFSNMYGNFQGAVQYSGDNAGPYATGYGIREVCDMMNNSDSAMDGMIAVNRYMSTMDYMNVSYFDGTANNYTDIIDYLQIEDFETDDSDFDSGARSWTWQTCTEFGYFQTTDVKEDTIFGPVTPLNLFINICQDVFGAQFTATNIAASIDATNNYYGGASGYKGTNVVIPNGSLDPWHALGKYNYTDPTVVPYLIKNTAHCADMYPLSANPQPGLPIVHTLINSNLDKWINGALSNKTVAITSSAWTAPTVAHLNLGRTKRAAPKMTVAEFLENANSGPTQYQKVHMGRPPHGLNPAPPANVDIPQDYQTGWFSQPVDHFDNTNTHTFRQRYWLNGQWAKEGGPMFLMIGGEGEENSKWVLNGNITYLTWAQQLGATVYLLEHRYYGQSNIGVNGKDQDLQYLSSLQMLYDVANFINSVNYLNANTQPWIVFGGSYSGALALWARQLFPDLIAGAVGSSGPIQAKLDFYEYLEVVEASIRHYPMNFSGHECAENIRQAFQEIHSMILTTEGVLQLNQLFNLKPAFGDDYDLSEINKQYFFSNLYGNYQGAVQYSGDNSGAYADSYGIPFMCSFMLSNDSALNNAVAFNEAMTEFYTGQTFNFTDNDYPGFVDYLKNGGNTATTKGTTGDAAAKYWTWQTCTEFGYFQSSDNGQGIFGSPTPVNLYTEMCKEVFGPNFTGPNIQASIDRTNFVYGGRDNYRGTNVVIPNGSIDPWHALGKFQGQTNSNSTTIVYINGTAHCADMYPARASDPASLTAARKTIGEFVTYWIKGGDTPPDPNKPATTAPTAPTDSPVQTTTKSTAVMFTLLPIVMSLLL